MNLPDLIYLLLASLVLTCAVLALVHHRQWIAERHRGGLLWCGTLLELVLRVQQHRGMAAAVLAGDPGFRSSLSNKRREIDNLLQALAALPQDIDKGVAAIARHDLPLLQQRWELLCRELDGLTPHVCTTRHTAVIGTLLTWLRSIGETCLNNREMAGAARLDFIVPVYVDRLPALSEALGQLRALGAAVVAAGRLEPAERVKLSFLIHQVSELSGRCESALEHAGLLQHADAARGFADTREKVQALLGTVCRDLLEPSRIELAPPQYFTTATQAIDSVFALAGLLRRRLSANPQQVKESAALRSVLSR